MVLSMTAFGRTKKKIGSRVFNVEVHSLNRKGLDITVNLPPELSFAEQLIRKKISQYCQRGQVTLKCIPENMGSEKLSEECCRRVHDSLQKIAKSLDESYTVSFDQVVDVALKYGNVVDLSENEIEQQIEEALDESLSAWKSMRQDEGSVLTDDIDGRVKTIENALIRIEKESRFAPQKYREKIMTRLAELGTLGEDDRNRVTREVVIFAEKSDVTEEIIRMKSHILQARKLLQSDGERSVGREAQFLVQEMMREMNTISSKSTEVAGVNDAIFIRGEIEKIKEQVQNIE